MTTPLAVDRLRDSTGSRQSPYGRFDVGSSIRGIITCGLLLATAWSTACTASVGAEEDSPARLAERFVESCVTQQRLAAGNAFLSGELARLGAIEAEGSEFRAALDKLKSAPQEVRQALEPLLEHNSQPAIQGAELTEALARLKRQLDLASGAWRDVRLARNHAREVQLEAESSGWLPGRVGFLLSADRKWFWLACLLAVACPLAALVHVHRHRLRRRLGARLARGGLMFLGLIACLAAGLIWLGLPRPGPVQLPGQCDGRKKGTGLICRNGPEGASHKLAPSPFSCPGANRRLVDEVEAVEARVEGLRTVRRTLESDVRAAWATHQQRLADSLPGGRGVAPAWQRLRQQTLRLAESSAVLAYIGRAVDRDLAELRWLDGCFLMRRRLRSVLGGVLMLVAAVGGLWCWRAARAGGGGRRTLAISVLGPPQSGKTHWLTMVHWKLGTGSCPAALECRQLPAPGTARFDTMVEQVFSTRVGTAPTPADRPPDPVAFGFRDGDLWGRTSIRVDVLDHSGHAGIRVGPWRRTGCCSSSTPPGRTSRRRGAGADG